MIYNKELRIQVLQNRIARLSMHPTENEKLIKKAQRELRKYL